MRDLYALLESFKINEPMDYCEEFNCIKSILEYCNEDVKPFHKAHFRGGNEPLINEVVRRIRDYLEECKLLGRKKYFNEVDTNKLRRITMFLILNTDISYKYDLKENNNVAHVLDICPLMPKFLVVTLMWELELDRYFYELLSYTPIWFSFQYFEPATDSLKYINDPFEVLEKVEQLLKAITIAISNSEFTETDIVAAKIICNKLHDNAMNLLRLFFTPDAEKFANFTKNRLYKYSGFAIKYLLQLILHAFNLFEHPRKIDYSNELKIYNILSSPHKQHDSNYSEYSGKVQKHLHKIITTLLNALQNNVMSIKVDVFLYWAEVDISANESLQMAVGGTAYEVAERMLANNNFHHDVYEQLKMIAIKPRSVLEIAANSTLGDILNTLDDTTVADDLKKIWLNELLKRKLALGNDECLQTIKNNLKLLSVENCQEMLNFIKLEIRRKHFECNDDIEESSASLMEIEDAEEEFEDLIDIVLLSLQNFNIEQLLILMNHQIKLFGKDVLLYKQQNTEQKAIEFLNRYTNNENFDCKQFLVLSFEDPHMMWQKLFDDACNNKTHISNYCSVVKQCRPLSENYFVGNLTAAMGDVNYLQLAEFPVLLCEIYFQLYYPMNKTEFMTQIIQKYVNIYLDKQQFRCLLPLVKALSLISSYGETQSYKPLNFGDITAPVLLTVAQIMDKARWDLITYTDIRDEIVRECIQFIQKTSKKFLPNAKEKDRKWITKVVQSTYKPLTQYYFQKFALTSDQLPAEFHRFLMRLDLENKSEAQLFLIINYVRCTSKETEWLARSEYLLPHITDVMITLNDVIKDTQCHSNAINNYRHCLINYANIVKKFLLPQIEDDSKQIEKLLMKIFKLIAITPEQIYEEIFMNFHCLLLEIIQKCGHPLDQNSVKIWRIVLEQMKDCSAKEIFFEKFNNLTSDLV